MMMASKLPRFHHVLLLLIAVGLADATGPTIDNIVKVLQSPAFQQIILPKPLVMADPMTTAATAADMPAASADQKPKPQMDSGASDSDSNPTLKLVTRVLDTLRSPPVVPVVEAPLPASSPAAAVLLVPQRRALPGCPLCDASVYSYCDYKVYHDACCCGTSAGAGYGHGGGGFGGFGGNGLGGYGGCGYQEDCSVLYANSCYEHQLIVNCCCNSPF